MQSSETTLQSSSGVGSEARINKPLKGWVALVTGASRGIGKGIALQLGQAGATVYVTGRPPNSRTESQNQLKLPMLEETALEVTKRGGKGIAVYCDHADIEEVKELFRMIDREQKGRIDILVNNAFSNLDEHLLTDRPFYEYPVEFFNETNNVGLNNHYGLIVTISSGGGINYVFNTSYGVNKAAKDRMAADMAHELKGKGIASVCLHVGPVKTELVQTTILEPRKPGLSDLFGKGESIEYSGMCVVALATDPGLMKKTGRILATSQLAEEYSLYDTDGARPACPVYSRWKDFYDTLNDVRTKTAL
ncbi:CRE-DHS-9 protein [Aphelenchoides avenae]|nr:CRE-DHS-9 protein [Aphelenchus avenae]